ncbi:MAG: ABC transporter ATP-binding protein [Rhodospirillaceae bacterium TMED8]|nr:ABC transporter ATP-binding protein [Magnetovibrio sp.]OUT50173.1 MAG: ABC transporter ATP-binding protein [Rhodospirillaceae bacterium TMED8]
MNKFDTNSFAGRVKRYAKVGRAAGGLATKLAGNRLFGQGLDNGQQALELKTALGGLKGPLMKVAQIMSTIPDILPEEYMAELGRLQNNAPSMGWPFVRRRMTAELGERWEEEFSSFERHSAAAASLGQVHRALDLDGQPLACKLQYPDMASAVEADLTQLKVIFGIYHRYDKAVDPSNIHTELSERLREELDYRREAKNMQLYGHMLRGEPGVHVPVPCDHLSTERLLSMSWLDGAPLMSLVENPSEVRNTIAENMFRAWYVPLYKYGVIHGDPHLGNYTVRNDYAVNLMDFGCIRLFHSSFVRAVIDLYRALRDEDEALAVHAFETWGFTNLDRNVISILSQWARFLYAPLLRDEVTSIQEQGGVTYGAGVAAKVHRELREVGGVAPPREFVLMDRAAIGLGSVFTHLKAEINWHRMFHGLIDDFDEQKLLDRQSKALNAQALPIPK